MDQVGDRIVFEISTGSSHTAALEKRPASGQESIMKASQKANSGSTAATNLSSVTGAHRRTLEAIFRHPSAHNLEWSDVVGLIGEIGDAHEKANSEFAFEVGGKRHVMHKPHTKDLTSSEVMDIRHFLMQAGFSPEHSSQAAAHPDPTAPNLLIVVDHHGAKIFQVDVTSNDASEHVIRPYDPHHFLHHLVHKDQLREQGQRAPEEPAYYEEIANAVAAGGRIVVVGHGTGKSDAAHHLTEYLKSHHSETYRRIVRQVVADLSSITPPQLLDLAREALRA
ncbi:hypothetical protein [Roseiarcus fermentans]|nr:hypothetical protein [Roseiarcus fermentans]